METTYTQCALGEMDGVIGVFNEFCAKRPRLKNEKLSEESAFIQFVNARNLQELMIAIDAISAEFGMTDFITDLATMGKRPMGTDGSMAKKVCKWFGEDNPTRTMLDKTREALDIWSIDKANPKFNPSPDGKPASMLYQFSLLEDIIVAQDDLRQTALLMAWLLGKTDFDAARSSLTFRSEEDRPMYLQDYYNKLKNNSGNALYDFQMSQGIAFVESWPEEKWEEVIQPYVASAFTVLMSDERKVMNEADLTTYRYFNTVISAAWSYFADGLSKEGGVGAISVCNHCGRFFEQKRASKQFCGDSCRVMYLRKHGQKPKDEAPETKALRNRRILKEAKAASKATNA